LGVLSERLAAARGSAAALGGSRSSNEDLFLWQRLLREVVGTRDVDCRVSAASISADGIVPGLIGRTSMQDAIAEIERKESVLIWGAGLAEEQPILYLRVRKAWRLRGCRVIEFVAADQPATEGPGHVADFAEVRFTYSAGGECRVAEALLALVTGDSGARDLCARIGLSAAQQHAVQSALASRGCGIIFTAAARRSAEFSKLVRTLAALRDATPGITLNVPAMAVNEQGAMDMGLLPAFGAGCVALPLPGRNTHEILRAAAAGQVEVLWVSQADLSSDYSDPTLAKDALGRCPFVVVNATTPSATTDAADLVLPVQCTPERDGTFTNCEGRVQRFWKAYSPVGSSRAEWEISAQVAARMGAPTTYVTWSDVLRAIANNVPGYAGCSPEALGEEGILRRFEDGPGQEGRQ
jgi:NADH-quinone oxidoreductase subunit G